MIVQVISFLAHLKEKGDSGPHIIVAPLSVLPTWQGEFRRWCPSMRVFQFYGSAESRTELWREHLHGSSSEVDVIITTYEMVLHNTFICCKR